MELRCAHLTAYQSRVLAGKEVSANAAGWLFVRVCAGNGYWLAAAGTAELEMGDVVIVPAGADTTLRASQLGDMLLCYFGVRTEQLAGFFTATEQQAITTLEAGGSHAARLIQHEEALARQHAGLCELRPQAPPMLVRAAMLALALQGLHEFLKAAPGLPPPASGPEQKFAELAARLPESELLARSASEWAGECGCTDRHMRRMFAARFGVSLKQKQIEWRLERAKKILLETDAKIIDIANQCGFQSLGQFNLAFKRLTQLTPSSWRKAVAAAEAKYKRQHPSLCPQLRSRQAGAIIKSIKMQ